jgi:hypothetical protein
MIKTNFVYNPTFSLGTLGWSTSNATLSQVASSIASPSYYGDSYGSLSKTGTSNPSIFTTTKLATTVGSTYTFSAYVKIPTGQESGTYQLSIGWYTAVPALVSTSTSASTSLTSASGWTRITVTGTAPATSTQAQLNIINTSGSTIGQIFLVDALQFENSATASQFVEPINQAQENNKTNNVLRPVPPPHLTGIELNADIMINGLLLNTIDNNNVLWVCTDIKGWWDLPDPEIQDLTRGLDDGSYDVRGRYTARNLTLVGSILVPNRSYTAAARDKLIAAINLVATGGWLYVDESPTKAAYVRLSGRPSIEVVNARGRIDFSIGLKAANPVKFKWNWNDVNGYDTASVAAAGSTTITNDGNFSVPMTLTLTGGTAGLTAPTTVVNLTTGKTLTVVKNIRGSSYNVSISTSQVSSNVVTLSFGATVHSFLVGDIVNVASITTVGRTGLNTTGAVITAVTDTTLSFAKTTGDLASLSTNGTVTLAAADILEIDTYNKSATFNGSATIARSYIDTLTDWVALQPGSNTIQFTPTSGSTALTVKYRSGWIG